MRFTPSIVRAAGGRLRSKIFHRQRRSWRWRFASQLRGQGLEIGALAHPMVVPDHVRVRYVDRLPVESLRDQYDTLPRDDVRQPDIVDDAQTLSTLPDASEDFIIAAHVLEHLPNPLQALRAWTRVVKPGGLIYLALPDRRFTFDRHRRATPLEHLVLDFERPSTVRDYEHYLDYALHVHRALTMADAIEEADRLLRADFSIHYHVFEAFRFPALLNWFITNVHPVAVEQGPIRPQFTDEFHTLLRVLPRATTAASR